mgnify:CR=1 FL=1
MAERNYRKEYDEFHGKPKQRKARGARNAANSAMRKAGKIKKGDGKDVHHKDHNPMNNSPGNLTAISSSKNKSMQSKKKKK